MGQLVPSSQRAVRVALCSPNGDARKPYQASSFKNSTGRSMTAPCGWGATVARAPARGCRQKCAPSASDGCRQFTSPVQRGTVRVSRTSAAQLRIATFF